MATNKKVETLYKSLTASSMTLILKYGDHKFAIKCRQTNGDWWANLEIMDGNGEFKHLMNNFDLGFKYVNDYFRDTRNNPENVAICMKNMEDTIPHFVDFITSVY